jgi:hypothetical protein
VQHSALPRVEIEATQDSPARRLLFWLASLTTRLAAGAAAR